MTYKETGDNVNSLYEINKELFNKYILKCKDKIEKLNFNNKELQEGFAIYQDLLNKGLITGDIKVGDVIKDHRLNMAKVKENHTYRVVNDTETICNKIEVNNNFTEVAKLASLFHDIARFPQAITSNTFHDKECKLFNGLSHAEYGYKMLYIDKMLNDYQIPKEYHYALALAVLNHQKNNSSNIHFNNVKEFLVPKCTISEKTLKEIKQCNNCNSVFMGVRKGDYTAEERHYGVFDQAYYDQAMSLIEKKVKNPVYYIFSNDIEWVKSNMNFGNHNIIFRTKNDIVSDFEELMLMASCKHSIIVNSTYHWWGARLNYYPGKLVIAPDKWFSDGKKIDIVPPSWLRI